MSIKCTQKYLVILLNKVLQFDWEKINSLFKQIALDNLILAVKQKIINCWKLNRLKVLLLTLWKEVHNRRKHQKWNLRAHKILSIQLIKVRTQYNKQKIINCWKLNRHKVLLLTLWIEVRNPRNHQKWNLRAHKILSIQLIKVQIQYKRLKFIQMNW